MREEMMIGNLGERERKVQNKGGEREVKIRRGRLEGGRQHKERRRESWRGWLKEEGNFGEISE